jgi:hypothetical protein
VPYPYIAVVDTYQYDRMFLVHQVIACPSQTPRYATSRKSVIDCDEAIGNVSPEQLVQKSDRRAPASEVSPSLVVPETLGF